MSARSPISRRDLLKATAAGVVGCSMSGWFQAFAEENAPNRQRRRACILLWMNGGPSQTDTFDMKPGRTGVGGPYRETATTVPGIRISEHLPRVARHMHRMSIIRAMNSREGDHGRGTFLMHTGFLPTGPIQYPTLGSLVSKELGSDESPLPNFVSIAPFRQFNAQAYGSGYLGPTYAPLLVAENFNPFGGQNQPNNDGSNMLRVPDLTVPDEVDPAHFDTRIDLLQDMERDFAERHPSVAARSHQTAYNRAVRLMPRRPARRSTSKRSRRPCVTRMAATCSARAACWPAGWSSAACRSSRSTSAPCRPCPPAGTRTARTSSRCAG